MIAFLAFFAGIDLGGLGTARGELKGSSPNGSEDWGHAVGQWIATNNAANVGIRTRIEATQKRGKEEEFVFSNLPTSLNQTQVFSQC